MTTTHVRLKVETVARLRSEIERLIAAADAGQTADPRGVISNNNPGHLGMSIDDMITKMLDNRERHRQGRRKAKRKARAAKKLPNQ